LRAGIVFIVLAASLFAVAQGATAATGASRLSLITEPNAGMGPIFSLLASAQHSVDVVMYELVDPRAEAILTSDAARGVRVRVLLD
jgi:phosphatidylserine/phosphatidylglycerophosphate/cardiolipin synthase-like enzyme